MPSQIYNVRAASPTELPTGVRPSQVDCCACEANLLTKEIWNQGITPAISHAPLYCHTASRR